MRGVSLLFAAIAGAVIVTALTLKDRQTPQVIKALADGGSHLIESSLGQR